MSGGTIYTETLVHSAPEQFVNEAPYQLIIVTLDGGGKITGRMASNERHVIPDHYAIVRRHPPRNLAAAVESDNNQLIRRLVHKLFRRRVDKRFSINSSAGHSLLDSQNRDNSRRSGSAKVL